ncbi:YafY family protein [Labrenzia sp. VG12]|uniref:helix-turn-helix transcriptional regulator n=1 Tax=Labrenzia sp. VG12 TaxID=2021862 RepID=UPI000B8C16F0|nr:YafY family protein [Labrenzia sp. VG12]ASP35711.1 transcriptional regulator [Labrenzia sp. VG12]
MKSSRLLSILMLLQVRGRMTAEALAAEFEASVRTIHRDIDQLSYAGVPVYAERGRLGGFRLLDGYQTRLTGLNEDEAGALLLSGLGTALDDLGLLPAATRSEQKILAALPEETREKAALVSDRFLLDPQSWYRSREATPFLGQVATAVWTGRKLALRYSAWKGEVERLVSPLAIVLKAGTWYLVAEAETIRVYRIANIQHLDLLEDGFNRPEDFNLRSFWDNWREDFETRLNSQQVTLKVTPEGLRRLGEAGLHPAVSPAFEGPTATVSLAMEDSPFAVRMLLSLGSEAEIVAPDGLREAVLAELQKMLGQYA